MRWRFLLLLLLAALPAGGQSVAEGLNDLDPAVRQAAREQARQLWPRDQKQLLHQARWHADPQSRAAAAEVLLSMPLAQGDEPAPLRQLLAAYGGQNAPARHALLQQIAQAAGQNPAANQQTDAPRIDMMLRILRIEPSEAVRTAAWQVILQARPGDRPRPANLPDHGSQYDADELAMAGFQWQYQRFDTALTFYRAALAADDPPAASLAWVYRLVAAEERYAGDPQAAADTLRLAANCRPSGNPADQVHEAQMDLFYLQGLAGPLHGWERDAQLFSDAAAAKNLYALAAGLRRGDEHTLAAMCEVMALLQTRPDKTPSDTVIALAETLINRHDYAAAWRLLLTHQPDTDAAQAVDRINHPLLLAHIAAQNQRHELAALWLQRAAAAVAQMDNPPQRDQLTANLQARIHFHQAVADWTAGDRKSAEAKLLELSQIAWQDPDQLAQCRRMLRELGRDAEQKAMFERSLQPLRQQLASPRQRGELLNALAWLCARNDEQLGQAGEWISAALKSEPENPAFLDTLAEIEFRLGRPAAALKLEQQAARCRPNDPFIQSQLRRFASQVKFTLPSSPPIAKPNAATAPAATTH